jgi:hypothetical protein
MSRVSLVLSLFVAFGFLGVAAPAAPTAPAQRENLPDLAAQAVTQFELAFRANPNDVQTRKDQLAAIVDAWRRAPRTEANNERLNNWLRAAIRASMPGSHDELPAAPSFTDGASREKPQMAKPAPAATRAPEPTLAVPTATPAKSDGQTDPFRDDPASKQVTK